MDERSVLEEVLQEAKSLDVPPDCGALNRYIQTIVDSQRTAVLAVVTTLVVKKIVDPYQDIRLHRADMRGGFGGRRLDREVITPFLKSHGFPYMREGTGWRTDSFNYPVPYSSEYPGEAPLDEKPRHHISPPKVKDAFLNIVDAVQTEGAGARDVLVRLFRGLVDKFDERRGSVGMDERSVLESALQEAKSLDVPPDCGALNDYIQTIVDSQRIAALAVVTTLMVKKIVNPYQDIRLHKDWMEGGFDGRGLDTRVVTPFLKSHDFPHMKEEYRAGWWTRSFDQPRPYNLEYPGKFGPQEAKDSRWYLNRSGRPQDIGPPKVKEAFLSIVDAVQTKGVNARDVLIRLFNERNDDVVLPHPVGLGVSEIVGRVEEHYNSKVLGASRLPVLAVHAVLKVVVREFRRYEGCELLPLEGYTAAGIGSGLVGVGDVQIIRSDNTVYEGFEVKHDIPVSWSVIDSVYQKIGTIPSVERYYILTTSPDRAYEEMSDQIAEIKRVYGCQVIVDGIAPTLEYYLRLVSDTKDFVGEYVGAVERDGDISDELKMRWDVI